MIISPSYEALMYLLAGALILLIVLVAGLTAFLCELSKTKKAHIALKTEVLFSESELASIRKDLEAKERRNAYLERENRRLTPYANMPTAFAEIEQRRIAAENRFLKATQHANDLINQAKTDADNLILVSRRQIDEKNEVGDLVLRQARERADAMLTDAAVRAEQIAGDAWDAKDRLGFYQRTVLAMKNKVKGYGDDYLIPNETLIENLSEQYDYEQASIQFKRVSNQIKQMIRDGLAAYSDYKDASRKHSAIALVLDAFNGKAANILATVGKDNFGKMRAKLEDAFELVNYNGKPFHNARILQRYLDLRLVQLKFATQVKELKRRDEEKQRRIKADMSDQRRAQKEFSRRSKNARKKPKRILKAIKKVEAEMAQSSAAQKDECEAQLAELKRQLSHAEARNRKIQSLSLQNKQGYVYVVSNIGCFGENVLKIGMTRRLEPTQKIKELGDSSVPFGFDVHAIVHSDDAAELERYLHNVFDSRRINKVNSRTGFFNVALGEVRAELESLNVSCRWTMKADAFEYRESARLLKVVEKENVRFAETLEIG